MKQQPIKTDQYASPSTRVITVSPAKCIAGSGGAKLSPMGYNELDDEEF